MQSFIIKGGKIMNELKLKLSDLRLRGCGFTLFKVLENNEEEQNVMCSILEALYKKSRMINETGYRWDMASNEEKNQVMPDFIDAVDISEDNIAYALTHGLLLQAPSGLEVTKKAWDIFADAAKIQKELDESGFFNRGSCPFTH